MRFARDRRPYSCDASSKSDWVDLRGMRRIDDVEGVFVAAALICSISGHAAELRPDQRAFRELYQELVETNTAASSGSCTLAAQRMADRLKAAGYRDDELTLFTPPAFPKGGGLVAVLQGSDVNEKAILLLAHIDVVEAKRDDWQRDPFQLIEEEGKFYGRGAWDDKKHAAI